MPGMYKNTANILSPETIDKGAQRLWDREVGSDVEKFVYQLAGEKGETHKGGAHGKPYVDLLKSLGTPTDDKGVMDYLRKAIEQITAPNLMKYTDDSFATFEPQRQVGLLDFDYWGGINNWKKSRPHISGGNWDMGLDNMMDATMFQKAMVERSKLEGDYEDPDRDKSTYGGWIPRMYQIFKDLSYGDMKPALGYGKMDLDFNKLLDRELGKGLARPDLVSDIEQKIKDKNTKKPQEVE